MVCFCRKYYYSHTFCMHFCFEFLCAMTNTQRKRISSVVRPSLINFAIEHATCLLWFFIVFNNAIFLFFSATIFCKVWSWVTWSMLLLFLLIPVRILMFLEGHPATVDHIWFVDWHVHVFRCGVYYEVKMHLS